MLPVLKLAPSPTVTPTPTPIGDSFYEPKNPDVYLFTINSRKESGCTEYDPNNPKIATAIVQVLIGGNWLEAKQIESGWSLKTSEYDGFATLKYIPWAKIAIDDGAQIRWTVVASIFHAPSGTLCVKERMQD